MHMNAMNQYGNRGFGGAPQPQRQGGRRGNNRGFGGGGNFRNNSRFDHNQQRNQNNQGGQRPLNESNPAPAAEKPQQQAQPVQQQQQAQTQPQKPQIQQQKPQIQQQKPQIQQQKPQIQQQKPQTQPPKPQTPATPIPVQQQQQQKPALSTPAKTDPKSKDNVDNAAPEQKTPQQNQLPQNQNQQQKPQQQQQSQQYRLQQNQNNMNGGYTTNKQGGWQGGLANKQGGGPFGQKRAGGPGGQGVGQGGPLQGQQGQGQQGQGQQGQGQQGQGQQGQGQQGQGQQGQGQQGQGQHGQGQHGQGQHGQGQQGQGYQGQGHGGPMRNQHRGGRGPMDGGKPIQREEQMLANKLKDLQGPILDLPPLDQSEVKFNGRSRLYIGNLTNDVTEEEILGMFGAYGETAELFLNKEKNFGFIKMDYRVNAERAKHELDGKPRSGKPLRVRFAPHNSAVRVKNLPPFVSNELLYRAFEIFGKIERAYVKVDERGKSLGEGVVEYVRKPSALAAIRNCTEKCFFLTSSLRPVIVESYEEPDELDGYPEKNLPKKHPEFLKARELGPRFSETNSFEHEYGTRWKQLHELHRQKEDALKKELSSEEEKLEAQMEYAKYEHETEMLREQLRQREQDRERQKRTWEMAERAADERREAERQQLLRQEEELSTRMRQQDDELRRRQQENTLFVQAQRLNSMLDRQEQGMFDQQKPMDGGYRDQFDMSRGGYDDMQGRGWDNRQMDDYPNKRRRF